MKNIKLTNDFHGTSAIVRAEVLDFGMHQELSLTKSQANRAFKKLCGMKDCTCGGIRGRQEIFGKKLVVSAFYI